MPSKQVEDVYNAGGFDGGPLGRPGTQRPRVPEEPAVAGLPSSPSAAFAEGYRRGFLDGFNAGHTKGQSDE